jgi:FkbM family methyltransferase
MAVASQIRRFQQDLTCTWTAMPASQALRWYAAVLRHLPAVLRERKFYAADAEMRGTMRFRAMGRTIVIEGVDAAAGCGYAFLRELFVRQVYFRGFTSLRFDTCLDLGFNIGVVASTLRQLAGPQGRVIGVDALSYDESGFRDRVLRTSGITFHHGVLYSAETHHSAEALAAICAHYRFDISLAISIEELLQRYSLQHIDFLKLDIEGAEFGIFRDDLSWLARVDNLAMEVHATSGNPEEIIQRLQKAGFAVSWVDGNGYRASPQQAGYIYASRVGSLRDTLR